MIFFRAITVASVQGEAAGCHVLASTIMVCAANGIIAVECRCPCKCCTVLTAKPREDWEQVISLAASRDGSTVPPCIKIPPAT